MFKLQIIIGSTRNERNSDHVCRWLIPAAHSQGAFEVEVLDLRDWELPMFQETIETVGDFSNPTYSDPIVKLWNEKIKEADAYIIVTPEYNHSIPAVLKNAIDTVFFSYSFRYKPVAFVGYSLGLIAGARAVEHLTSIMVETEAVPVRTATLIPLIANAFNNESQPVNPGLNNTMNVMLEDLAWLAKGLKAARNAGDLLPPAALRLRKGK